MIRVTHCWLGNYMQEVLLLTVLGTGCSPALAQVSWVTSLSDGGHCLQFRLWQKVMGRARNAEAYNRSGFSDVMKALERVVAGRKQLQLCEVTNSTAHKLLFLGRGYVPLNPFRWTVGTGYYLTIT